MICTGKGLMASVFLPFLLEFDFGIIAFSPGTIRGDSAVRTCALQRQRPTLFMCISILRILGPQPVNLTMHGMTRVADARTRLL